MRKFSILVALAAALSIAQNAVELDSEPVNRVARKLSCSCGCAQDMSCNMIGCCGICKRAKTIIYADQKAGKNDSQILDEFAAENGKQILKVTPGMFGTAGPFVALSLGAILVLLVIRKMRQPRPAGHAPAIDPALMDRINKDMAKLD
jgi:cytochrome c-type biogenesis protein CcmH/NrfF